MGNSQVNNVEWVRANAQKLDPNDQQQVFKYVRLNHPLSGCTFATPPELTGKY